MGDTSTFLLDSDVPAVAPVKEEETPEGEDDKNEPEEAVPEETAEPEVEEDPANTVVLTRDGKHTIPYEKLQEAREEAKQAKAALAELQAQLSERQERQDAGGGNTVAQNAALAEQAVEAGVDPALFGDWTAESLAKGVAQLARAQAEAIIKEELAKALEPVKAKHAQDETAAHFAAIAAKHPDYESIAESQELQAWINQQPAFARAAYQSVIEKGSAADVVEMLDAFKSSTAAVQPAPEAVKAKAKQAAQQAQAKPPVSLSDIPGGKPGPANPFESVAAMNPLDMTQAMESWTPEQIEAFLNRTM